MRPDLDPARLAPGDRAQEVATILALGLRRLRARAALAPTSATQKDPEDLSESLPDDLANGAEKSVTVHPG